LREDGRPIPNLYAGGGTAAGISGDGCDGYMSGNGLLTALGLGMIAAEHAAASIRGRA
jgi:fumarate reductase flavoprotein subunit